jgi:signal transduction histidine kinase
VLARSLGLTPDWLAEALPGGATVDAADDVGPDTALVFLVDQPVAMVHRVRHRCPAALLIAVVHAEVDLTALVEAGADDFIVEPVADDHRPALIAKLRRTLNQRAADAARRRRAPPSSRPAPAVDPIWSAVADLMPEALLVVAEGGRIEQLNPTACAMLEADDPAAATAALVARADAEPWATILAILPGVLAGGPAPRASITATADVRVWDVAIHALDMLGRARRTVVVLHEITERVRSRRVAEFSQRMASVGALVAGVAHEVRNPLFGISAIADALECRAGEPATPSQHLTMLRSAVARLTRLMNDLLALGSTARIDREAVSVAAVARDARAICAALTAECGVTITIDADDALPTVDADRVQLVQVFQNVLDNALRHAPRGSVVEVAIGLQAPDHLRCTVRDHGPGFGEHRPHVFEPFFSRRKGGTGLGLAIVRQSVEGHGGAVTATDAPGGGGLITIDLPLLGPAQGTR